MLFILLWLISPIILLILFLVQLSANADLKRSNRDLREQVNALLSQLSENSGGAVSAPQQPEPADNNINTVSSNEDTNRDSAHKLPPMPEHNISQTISEQNEPCTQPQNTSISTACVQNDNDFAKPAAVPNKKNISTINIILILGALFLSLSGFIFAAATWGALNTFFKTVVLVSFSALFFGIHSFTERKLRLEQTGRVFYILGSVFLPAAIIAAGLLKVFGEYLSFYGDGRLLVFAMTSLSVCIPFFKGAHDYKNRIFAAVSHYSFSATIIFTLFHVIPRADIAVLFSAIYSLLIVVAEPFIKQFYDSIFGEDNVFSSQYGYFALISTTALGIISTCIFLDDTFSLVTLLAFAIYSACFLTKSITEKNGIFSSIAFAFFITISLFSGFDPDNISSITCVIAATALIYATLSAMGLLPEIIRKILKGFAIAAAGIAGALAVAENISYLIDNSVPSWEMVLASGVVSAEMLILAIRYKSNKFRTFTFASVIWFVTDLLLIFELGLWGILITFAVITAYFLITRLTPLKDKLYAHTNDIVFTIYTIVNSICSCVENDAGCFAAIAVLAVGIICTIICRNGKLSAILCPILTFQVSLPLFLIFADYNIIFPYATENGDSAMSVILILFCILGSLLLFVPKAENYAKSYGISVICLLPVFFISCMLWESADFVSMLAVCIYTAVFMVKSSFPKEKFSHINLLNSAILITSLLAGFKFLDDLDYLMCFPAVAIMLIFAVYALGEAFDVFPKVNPHICTFLWWTAPFISGCMAWSVFDSGSTALLVFSIILSVCSAFTAVVRKNTLNLIYPIFTTSIAIGSTLVIEAQLIFVAVLVIAGRILFNRKVFDKLYIDVLSIGAFLPAISYFFESCDDIKEWLTIIVYALLTINFIRKEQTSAANRRCITAAGVFMFPLFWAQPFFDIPEMIDVQFNLLPVFFFCLLVKLIWKDAEKKADNFSFVAAIISLVILFMESFTSGESFDAVFIGVVLFIMLAISFIIKKKRWFVLAVASMVASGVLLSFGQRDSIAWLVYLALAGAALIALGLANELKKQQQKTGEETKLSRFMSDWTW